MGKKSCLVLLVLAAMLLIPRGVSAHVLIRDQVSDTGALLHVDPNDDPVAGETASLFFDIRDRALNQPITSAQLTIVNDQGDTAIIPSRLQDSTVTASYVFPAQGLYQIQLVIKRNGTVTHRFVESQRVSRGILGSVSAPSAPGWARAGLLFTTVAGVCTAIIAFNRRKAINDYSKF